VDKVYAKLQQNYKLRKSDVHVGMTLDFHIWQLTDSDSKAAKVLYEAERARLSEKECARKFANSEISVDMFDRSALYRRCVANYIDKKGRIPGKTRDQFEAESDRMVSCVLAETNILFTTASNTGGKLIETGASFKPTVIICDEAGQISIPSLCVPLTCFNTWEGSFLIGDPNQLHHQVTSGRFNKFFLNSKISPVAMLAQKGFPSILLDTQY